MHVERIERTFVDENNEPLFTVSAWRTEKGTYSARVSRSRHGERLCPSYRVEIWGVETGLQDAELAAIRETVDILEKHLEMLKKAEMAILEEREPYSEDE